MIRSVGWLVGGSATAAVGLALPALLLAGELRAQHWNDRRALELVTAATERRAQQLADSGLVDYSAQAHGYLTFLAQLGEGFREPPQVVKADELALEVYWRAPNLSKQRIVGRRDTTLLPTDINYHRDHLGIVQNNFPAIIRLGDGDEVMDVPHPLSGNGLSQYDFAISDSLRMTLPGRVISVYEVKVRPRDDRQPRVIGALYLDRDNAQVVRMALSFTRAAFKDPQLEDLFVVLENGLVGTRFWLPRRQEIEIRRTATWMEYPVRGIIRGRWEIRGYELNTGLPVEMFAGPEIVAAPAARLRTHDWPSARILDSLPPDVRAVTADEVRRVQAEVRQLVREQALRRTRGSALAARGVSDFLRFNRVEGLAMGAGIAWRLGGGLALSAAGRHGIADNSTKGQLEAAWRSASGSAWRIFYANDFREAGDVRERSTLVNSFAAQELASDYTNPYRAERFGASAEMRRGADLWKITLSRELHRALAANATPAHGRFEQPVAAAPLEGWRVSLTLEQPTRLSLLGFEARGNAEVRVQTNDQEGAWCGSRCESRVVRGSFDYALERPVGELRIVSRTVGAAVGGGSTVWAQDLVFLGGPWSAPGYSFHSLVGDRAIAQTLEARVPVPFPSFSLGRFGRSPARAQAAPHVSAVMMRQEPPEISV